MSSTPENYPVSANAYRPQQEAGRSPLGRRPVDCPVEVNQAGIRFGDAGRGEGARFVPWESITGVVLFESYRRDSGVLKWGSAIGVQLAGHPDGMSVRRSLSGWSLDRHELRRAVAQFGGGVEVVDGEREEGYPATPFNASEPLHTSLPPEERPKINWDESARRYQPSDPEAYLGRSNLRTSLPGLIVLGVMNVVSWAVLVPLNRLIGLLCALVFAFLLWALVRSLRAGGEVHLAVDRPGIFFSGSQPPEAGLVPWADIAAVVVFDYYSEDSEQGGRWARAVGVRLRGETAPVQRWCPVTNWPLDGTALEAAVTAFGPGVPVIDGPPQLQAWNGQVRQPK